VPLTLFIKDLVVQGRHGVHEHEKTDSQHFGVTVELQLNNSAAAESDNLEDTVDWSRLRDDIAAIVRDKSFDLIERLAREIADTVLKNDRVAKVTVTVDKLEAFESGVPGVRLELQR
jgi:dihydroneopterin aldolase